MKITVRFMLVLLTLSSLGLGATTVSEDVLFRDQFQQYNGLWVHVHLTGKGQASPYKQNVDLGDSASIRFLPEDGYRLASATGCGGYLDGHKYLIATVEGHCSVSALFEPNQYTISFDSSGGSAVEAITQEYDSSITPPTAPTKEGYTFTGWNPAIPNTMPAEDTTLTAQWDTNQYTISFDSNGGSAVASITQEFGTTITTPTDPTKEGYTFNGWNPSLPATMTSRDLTLAAQWQPNQYTISFDSSGGSAVEAITQEYDSSITPPTAPTKEGYTFTGWNPAIPNTMPAEDTTLTAQWALSPGNVSGQIQNYSNARPAIATIQSVNDLSILRSQKVKPDGSFLFKGLDPSYQYSVEITQPGYRVTPAVNSEIGVAFMTNQARKAGLSTKKKAVKETSIMSALTGASAEELLFQATSVPGLDDGVFQFHWSEDVSVSGAEYMSYINEPLDIEWLDKETSDITSYAAAALFERYEILLIDDKLAWSDEHAYRLLQMIERTGIPTANEYPQDQEYPYAGVWSLSEDALTNDMVIDWDKAPPSVTVSAEAFLYASPRIAKVEGKRGTFYSNRLFEVAVRFVTADGTDMDLASRIIRQRYGINIAKDAYFEGRYSHIPIPEVDRYPDIWQQFHADEVIELMAMLEEFPPGMRNISSPDKAGGLRNALRRRNGLTHPWYPEAAAVAWPFSGHDYIEFMDKTFIGSDLTNIHRLIIHEKAHFVWSYLLSNDIKYEWLKKSGWYLASSNGGSCDLWNQNPDEWSPPYVDPETLNALPEHHNLITSAETPAIESGWASCSTTQFVTAYAAKINPGEDFAESLAFFLRNPDMLRSRALPKYEFIRDYIMQNSIYLSVIRPDLTFQVLNLYPDYIYPGKINRIDTEVKGHGEEDKQVRVGIGLHLTSECTSLDNEYCFEGAKVAGFRLESPSGKASLDGGAGPDTQVELSDSLSGTLVIPAEAEPGWWYPRSIILVDQNQNRRIEKLISGNYGWKLYINNTNPDLIRPSYIPGSISLDLRAFGDPENKNELAEGEQELGLSWLIKEDRRLHRCRGSVVIFDDDVSSNAKIFYPTARIEKLDVPHPSGATHRCETEIRITKYYPRGHYGISELRLEDYSLEAVQVPFANNHPIYEAPTTIYIHTPTPDVTRPQIDISRCVSDSVEEQCLRVSAQPTRPDDPNGETLVRVYFWVWDEGPKSEASGVSNGSLRLRNPQGQEFFHHVYEAALGCPYYEEGKEPYCDPTEPAQYVFETLLPVGSAPGTWGLTELSFSDKAGNVRSEQFTETLRFDVD